jgi:arginine-tRNA-protein transferase
LLDVLGDESFFNVYWLRYDVPKVVPTAKNRKLTEAGAHFTKTIRPFSITDELQELHTRYVCNLSFKTAETLESLFFYKDNEVFDTYIIEIRDNGKLIAAGIFDKGLNSIQGLINIYDPEYKKYSPGRFLMMLKYNYCLEHNLRYYYPGYYTPDHPVFDYKLFLDKSATEVFLPIYRVWIPYPLFIKLLEEVPQ